MKVIERAIRLPVTTAVGVILLIMFGTISLLGLPVQLTPTVDEPKITVTTSWPGASPKEIEREIVDEQEEQLKSLEGLVEMKSTSSDNRGQIVLTFLVGTDLDAAVLKVSNRLDQVPSYPADAEKPVILTSEPGANAIGWWGLFPRDEEGYAGDISELYDFVDNVIKPEFERVPGVASAGIFGGREREMQVIVNPAELAARQLTINELAEAIERENRNFSGGDFDEGKRRYIVRTVGEYASAEDIEQIVVAVRSGVPVYLRDVARAELGYRKPTALVYEQGVVILALNAGREPGANVLEVMAGLERTVDDLNLGRLRERGLELIELYDQTDYIYSAITLVRSSLLIGGVLAVLVLLLFLRSFSSTLVVAVAIPISVVGSFIMMAAFGRTLNVVSLAGMAFAVGMVVDSSIVVLENIYRHRQMGKQRFEAAMTGAREVWGAVLASTLTTIAVFVPVVFIAGEIGQLFGDIAIAISCAVALSLIVSITVIPSLSNKILAGKSVTGPRNGLGLESAGRVADGIAGVVHRITGSTALKLLVIGGLTSAALLLSAALLPDREYLPTGNQNFVFGFLLPPPGYSLDEVSVAQSMIAEELRPLWESEPGSPEARAQPGGGIRHYFFVVFNNQAFVGAKSNDDMRTEELLPVFQQAAARIPGAIFFMTQSSIFERGLASGRAVEVELTGPELERLMALGLQVFRASAEVIPGSQARPEPSLELGNPELHVRTHRQRAAELGVSNRELGYAVSALIDGVKASDYQHLGDEIDLVIRADEGYRHRTHLLDALPIATPSGELVTLGTVADIVLEEGPAQIAHFERERTIRIIINPPDEMALEDAMRTIDNEILDPMRADGSLQQPYNATLAGTAAKLTAAWEALRWNLLLALIITYLLMAALFESFLYPFVIMFSVPLAAFGGFAGLAIMHAINDQKLDVLTMLGFVILLGTVVNNAILIVHQSLNHMREDAMVSRDAIHASVRSRIRPIFMSVSTSVFGMLPLVLFPGAGSELYRGLGSVVVGGLVVSTVFTLFLVPAMFSLSLDVRDALVARLRRARGAAEPV